MSRASIYRTKLHRIVEEHTNWTGTIRKLALGTDKELAEAEDFVFAGESK
jgi:hypothetical protein